MSPNYLRRGGLLAIGMTLQVIFLLAYFFHGYSTSIFWCWLVSLALLGIFFFLVSQKTSPALFFDRKDWIIVLVLLGSFFFVYTLTIYEIPFQVSSDEILVGRLAQQAVLHGSVDPFGPSTHYKSPNLVFIIWGTIAQLTGNINLFSVRLVHALSGLLIIVLMFLWLRSLSFSRPYAAGGAVIMGFGHALMIISRMALRDNTPLLIELAAFTLLYLGQKRKSLFISFFGGVVAGLSFYTYEPARVLFPLWIVLMVLLHLLFWMKKDRVRPLLQTFVAVVGFTVMVLPMLLNSFQTYSDASFKYQRMQLMVFPEARELQRNWTHASSIQEGVRRNTASGLTMFFKNLHDQGYIYTNFGHGFLDPLSRLLFCMGAVIVIIRLLKSDAYKTKEQDVMALLAFFFLWMFFTFLTTKNPNYTRLLIVLPFIIYLVLVALRSITDGLQTFVVRYIKKYQVAFLPSVIFLSLTVPIALANIDIVKEYVFIGLRQGNDVGGTGRYIESRKSMNSYTFLLVTDSQYPYFSWGNTFQVIEWMQFFATKTQTVSIIPPNNLLSQKGIEALCDQQPFTLFLSKDLYQKMLEIAPLQCKGSREPAFFKIKPDDSLMAIEFK